MKLLFDQNLSPRLVANLADLFPSSAHVEVVGLGKEIDRLVWEYAKKNEYVIVSKDADFSELGSLLGFPPKIIWLRKGNCTTQLIENILRQNHSAIERLVSSPDAGILMLF